jgi:hypothetical protein
VATEHDSDQAADHDAPAPAHGPAGKAKGKGKGLLNGPHREMIIVVCSVVGVGLAYLSLAGRSSAAGGASLPTGAAGALTGTGQVAGFDTAAVQGLQAALANQSDLLRNLVTATPATSGAPEGTTPTPLAAGMFSPDPNNHNWILMPNGVNAQVQRDGSLFGGTAQQFFAAGATLDQRSPVSANLDYYSTQRNVQDASAKAAG